MIKFSLSSVNYGISKSPLDLREIGGKKVVIFEGRFHAYEGLCFFEITYPIRLMHSIAIKKVIISNAAGAINLNIKKGK